MGIKHEADQSRADIIGVEVGVGTGSKGVTTQGVAVDKKRMSISKWMNW